jgi:hypothetical protein
MASQYTLASRHDKIALAVEEALREIWKILQAHERFHDLDEDPELGQAIADKLMNLVDSGVTDPKELRRQTLEMFDLKPTH